MVGGGVMADSRVAVSSPTITMWRKTGVTTVDTHFNQLSFRVVHELPAPV